MDNSVTFVIGSNNKVFFMRKIYISFLGLGNYDSALYCIDGINALKKYEYVQTAEIEISQREYGLIFDKIFIIVTPESKEKHFKKLEAEMAGIGIVNVIPVELIEEKKLNYQLDASGQWTWFERILALIEDGDELTIDLTHGYRIFSIVLSTAINFIQKSKKISMDHVWYGAYEKNKNNPPIIDMKDFYIINEWADAVSRLIDDADARKLVQVAKVASESQIGNLNDPEIAKAFEQLTDSVRNVEIHKIGERTSKALKLIDEKREKATSTGRILLDLVTDKFTALASGEPASGKYDLAYFKLQLEIIKLLIDHKLFMQAYTVMRECIGSIGLIKNRKAKTNNKEGRSQRFKADIFVNMIQFDEWVFSDSIKNNVVDKLMPFYDELQKNGTIEILKSFCKKLVDYRNGFDHAWTKKPEAAADINDKANEFFDNLKIIIDILEKEKILQ